MKTTLQADILRRAQLNQSDDAQRRYICGVLITPADVVATDGHMLYHANSGERCELPEAGVLVSISGKVAKNAVSASIEWQGEVSKDFNKPTNGTLTTKTERGVVKLYPVEITCGTNYPNWRQIVPEKTKDGATINVIGFGGDLLKRIGETFPVGCHFYPPNSDAGKNPWTVENEDGGDRLIVMPRRTD